MSEIQITARQARELLAIFEDIKETYPMQSALERADKGIAIVREILGFGTTVSGTSPGTYNGGKASGYMKGDIDEG